MYHGENLCMCMHQIVHAVIILCFSKIHPYNRFTFVTIPNIKLTSLAESYVLYNITKLNMICPQCSIDICMYE